MLALKPPGHADDSAAADLEAAPSGNLLLGYLLQSAGIKSMSHVSIARDTYRPDGLHGPQVASSESVRLYTRRQDSRAGKILKTSPGLWLVFMAAGQRRSPLFTAYENRGEVLGERHDTQACFDLHEPEFWRRCATGLSWSGLNDTGKWAKTAPTAAAMPVVEIADPQVVPC